MFQGDHLTATWLVAERFRDHIALRLGGNYVVAVPNRDKLIAVRADEPGLIASITAGNRSYRSQPYPLTAQLFAVGGSTAGGTVALYTQSGQPTSVLDANSPFTSRGGISTKPVPQPLATPEPNAAPLPTSFTTSAGFGAFPGASAPASPPLTTSDSASAPFMAPTAPTSTPARKQPLVDLSAWGEEETEETPAPKTPWNRSE